MSERMQSDIDDRKTSLEIYEPTCSYCYDLISVKGFMRYDYKKILEECRALAGFVLINGVAPGAES